MEEVGEVEDVEEGEGMELGLEGQVELDWLEQELSVGEMKSNEEVEEGHGSAEALLLSPLPRPMIATPYEPLEFRESSSEVDAFQQLIQQLGPPPSSEEEEHDGEGRSVWRRS